MTETTNKADQGNTTQNGIGTSNTETTVTTVSIPSPVVEKKPLLYFGRQVEIGSRIVQLIRVEKFNLIPKTPQVKSIQDEVTIKIGSQWVKGTKNIIRGLTPEEERKFLPEILGVNANSEKWENRVLEHWAEFSIQIPNDDKGIIFETGYQIRITNGVEEIVPIKLDDYMKYHFCKVNGEVANEDDDNLSLYKAKLVDRAKQQRDEERYFEQKKSVEATYLKLISSTDKKDMAKIDWILETVGGPDATGISIVGLSPLQKEMEVEKLKNNHLDVFVKAVKDEDLELKAMLRKAISVGKLSLEGETYVLGNKVLGNLANTILYYKDMNNVKDRQILTQALQ